MPSKASPGACATFRSWKVILNDGSTYLPMGTETQAVKSNWTNTATFGENLKGWRQLLRDGQSATTSLSGSKATVRVQTGKLEFTSNFGVERRASLGGIIGNLSVQPPASPAALNETKANAEALGRFATKVVSARSAIQGGVVVGELGQTLRMIKNPARGLRRLVDDWLGVARRLRSARRIGSLAAHRRAVAQNLADSWLEYAFGWKPLLNDVRDGCKALDSYHAGQPLAVKRVTSTAKTSEFVSEASSIQGAGLASWKETSRTMSHVLVIYRGAVRVKPIDPKQMDPALFGFSPEQFLPTAWELIPYSFLIDYFTNIGDIVYGWSSLICQLAWCNRTARKTYVVTRGASCDKSLNSNLQSCTPSTIIAETTSVDRQKYNGTTVPDFQWELPSFGSLRWLNLAALVASRRSDRSWSYD